MKSDDGIYKEVDVAALRQRLFRILWSALALENSTIKILERTTLHCVPPEAEDVAELTDRLHELFNSYSFLTRTTIWQDACDDAELEDQPDHLQHP